MLKKTEQLQNIDSFLLRKRPIAATLLGQAGIPSIILPQNVAEARDCPNLPNMITQNKILT